MIKEEEQASSNPVIVQELNNLEAEVQLAVASKETVDGEDFPHGLADDKSLKRDFPRGTTIDYAPK